MNKKLTIILTIKGRHLHSLRWMWHANKIKLPFPIIIADGEVDPSIERILDNKRNFPNINYQYIRYKDLTVKDYYFKRMDAISRVKTSYVISVDNDDFLITSGLDLLIDFLDNNSDYVGAQARIAGFKLINNNSEFSNVQGVIKKWSEKYIDNEWYDPLNFDEDIGYERVRKLLENPRSIYYCLFRTNDYYKVSKEIYERNPCLNICELYSQIRFLSIGKVYTESNTFSYTRQQDTSQRLGYSEDIIAAFINTSLAEDIKTLFPYALEQMDNICPKNRKELLGLITSFYSNDLKKSFISSTLQQKYRLLFRIKNILSNLSYYFKGLTGLKIFLNHKSKKPYFLNRKSLQTYEFLQISYSLNDNLFSAFVIKNAPLLLKKKLLEND